MAALQFITLEMTLSVVRDGNNLILTGRWKLVCGRFRRNSQLNKITNVKFCLVFIAKSLFQKITRKTHLLLRGSVGL